MKGGRVSFWGNRFVQTLSWIKRGHPRLTFILDRGRAGRSWGRTPPSTASPAGDKKEPSHVEKMHVGTVQYTQSSVQCTVPSLRRIAVHRGLAIGPLLTLSCVCHCHREVQCHVQKVSLSVETSREYSAFGWVRSLLLAWTTKQLQRRTSAAVHPAPDWREQSGAENRSRLWTGGWTWTWS